MLKNYTKWQKESVKIKSRVLFSRRKYRFYHSYNLSFFTSGILANYCMGLILVAYGKEIYIGF